VAAFAGAMPPLIGYAAANGNLSADAWALAAILFVWQLTGQSFEPQHK